MRIGILQPYIFPYIGYFQLINAVDRLVIYDDAQWIKGGWINRNRILVQGNPTYVTLPVAAAPLGTAINERVFSSQFEWQKRKILRTLVSAYERSMNFDATYALVEECFSCGSTNVAEFVANSLRVVCDCLGIDVPFRFSSELVSSQVLTGEDRVLDICKLCESSSYVNPIGGVELYSCRRFASEGIELRFLKSNCDEYFQLSNRGFISSLSILDVLMHCSGPQVAKLLGQYELVEGGGS